MIDIEKLAKEAGAIIHKDGNIFLSNSEKLKQFADALLEDKEREVAELNNRIKFQEKQHKEDLIFIMQQKAHINDLREALGKAMNDEAGWYEIAKQALTKTPAQSLQDFENEVIERCAQLSDACVYMSENFNALSEEIRALKVNND